MLNKIFYILLFTALASCSETSNEAGTIDKNATSPTQALSSQVSYKMISTEEGQDDASLPQGYWQSIISYPELNGNIKEPVKNKINNEIIKLSKEYKCETHGDYAFSSEVKFIDSKLFSMTYEIMWMCPQMASPDSTIGALNYNLHTGEVISLKSEVTNASAYKNILSIIAKKLISQNKGNSDCPAKDTHTYFYSNKTSLFFVVDVESHSDSGCITEIEIAKDVMAKHLKAESVLLP